jgi:hypothetical protein
MSNSEYIQRNLHLFDQGAAMSEIRTTEYAEFLVYIKSRIRQRQYQAFRAVNTELVALYWEIGESIDRNQQKLGWGKAVPKLQPLVREISWANNLVIFTRCKDKLERQQISKGRKMKKSVLDDEEKAILESYESGEWEPVKDTRKEINKLQQCAYKYAKPNGETDAERRGKGIQENSLHVTLHEQFCIEIKEYQ